MSLTARRRQLLALLATSLGWLLLSLDLTVVTVALPTMASDFTASVAEIQWVVSSYVITVAGLLIVAGVLGDRWGCTRVYSSGLLVFAAGSVISALSPTLPVLVLGRVGQGVGAAAMTATGLALLTEAYGEDTAGRTKAIGWWAAIGGVGGSIGILIGGVVVSEVGWRPLFWINLPIVAVALLLVRMAAVPNSLSEERIDVVGLFALVSAVVFVSVALATITDHESMFVAVMGALAALAFVMWIWRQHVSEHPVIPRSVLASDVGRRSLLVAILVNTAFYSSLLAMTIYFQKGLGWSAALTGVAFLPAILPAPIAMPIVGRLAARLSPQRILIVLTLLGGIGFALMAFASESAPYVVWGFALLLMTLGTSAIVVAPLTRMLMSGVDRHETGAASGALTMMRQVGASLGASLLAILAGTAAMGAVTKAGWVGLALAVVTLIVIARPIRATLERSPWRVG